MFISKDMIHGSVALKVQWPSAQEVTGSILGCVIAYFFPESENITLSLDSFAESKRFFRLCFRCCYITAENFFHALILRKSRRASVTSIAIHQSNIQQVKRSFATLSSVLISSFALRGTSTVVSQQFCLHISCDINISH